MAGFGQQVKVRTKGLQILVKKGIWIVGKTCKNGWLKVKNIRR